MRKSKASRHLRPCLTSATEFACVCMPNKTIDNIYGVMWGLV